MKQVSLTMKLFAILAVITLMVASSDAILNGQLVAHKPYYARISFRLMEGNQQEVHNKAGAIISDRFVITTGYFFASSFDFTVWVGSNNRATQQGQTGVAMIRISTHPDGPALIQLTTPMVFSSMVQPIKMVTLEPTIGLNNEQGMILGLGGTTALERERLHAAYMRIIPAAVCAINYPTRNNTAYFCAYDALGRSDFCPEDRGSALTIVSRGVEYLVGIAIEGVCVNTPHVRPSLFASIAHFRNRINEILNGL